MSRLFRRPQPAPTTGTTQLVSAAATPASAPIDDRRGVAPAVSGRGSRMQRRVLAVGGSLIVGILAAAVLAGSMSDAITSRAQAQEVEAANQAIAAQVEAGRREVEFAQTDAFLDFTARSFGYGRRKERQFALGGNAPTPAPITPLGDASDHPGPVDTLGAVLELLFER